VLLSISVLKELLFTKTKSRKTTVESFPQMILTGLGEFPILSVTIPINTKLHER